ncbi:hypothetical protein [Streptomyces sp. NPDC090112]|uniref:hypothetical protein n=1 Tax=Streptomyces sp. NPDC090112 TaxID=3365949 RepID=UPI0038223E29
MGITSREIEATTASLVKAEPRTEVKMKSRTAAWRLGAVAVAAAALVAVPLTGTAMAAQDTVTASAAVDQAAPATAAGQWNVKAIGDDGHVIDTVMTLKADGTLTNNVGGKGTWTSTGRNTFTFKLTERFYDEHGTLVVHIEVTQNARLCAYGRTFTSTGTARTYDSQGAVINESGVRVEAVRV